MHRESDIPCKARSSSEKAGDTDDPGRTAGTPQKDNAVDPVVFGVSYCLVVVFCVLGAVASHPFNTVAESALDWVMRYFGWLFVLSATGFVIFSVVLAASPYGRIPLAAREDDSPEFSTVSWCAMLFSAGMGIGLMFYGIYEPVTHLAEPFPPLGVEPGSPEAARHAMAYTFFHWGLHPWAIYAVVAMALGYSTFRKGRGNLLSSPFQAVLGAARVVDRGWGKPIDILALVATKFGGATSLGLGALQIAGGLYIFTGIGGGFAHPEQSRWLALVVLVVLDILALISAVSGVSRGIKWLSNINMVLAAVLLLFIMGVGPTVFLLDLIPLSFGAYMSDFVGMSFQTASFGGRDWLSTWTVFYWAWWISWTPFVSTFIARISRGRTIREFVVAVLVVPTVVSGIWFVMLGGAGMHLQLEGVADVAGAPAPEVAFFTALEQYPLFWVTGIVVMVLTAIFWVSGADAAAVVLGMLSSRGATEPKTWLLVLWKVSSAAVAAVLLLMGGLHALETFTILVASPFVLIMIALCWAFYVDLRQDPLMRRGEQKATEAVPGTSSS